MLGQELIEELQNKTQKVNNDIAGIKDEIKAIDEQLKEHEGYDVDSIKARKGLEADKKLFEESLQKAKEHKESLIAGNTKDTVKRGLTVIRDYKKELNEEVAEDNERIAQLVEEIKGIYDKHKAKDSEARENIRNFVDTVEKYTDPTPVESIIRYGDPQPRIDLLMRETGELKTGTYFTIIDGFLEHRYNIQGLYPPKWK